MKVIGVIPARYDSVRFPGKPLAPLAGRPMVLHVLAAARGARRLDRVLVATYDARIADVVLNRAPVRSTAKIFADQWHVLWVNGERAGSGRQRPGDPLVLHEIAGFLSRGFNRIAIEAGSETGVGGLLFSLDLADSGRDAVFSDGRWRVDPSRDAIQSGGRYRAEVWGRPPMYPWGWPRLPRPNEVSR